MLYDFITNEALPGTGIDPDSFWAGVDKVVTDLTPQNQDLLARRDELQAQIDKWHRQRVIGPIDAEEYQEFLTEIGYLLPEPADFTITTSGVDDEITTHRGPAAGGADPQRPVRAERRQRPVGLAVRRALRHRRDPRERRRREGRRLQQGPRRQGHRLRPQVPRRGGAAGVRLLGRRYRAQVEDGAARRSPSATAPLAWPTRRSSPATPASSAPPTGRCCWSTTACTSRS